VLREGLDMEDEKLFGPFHVQLTPAVASEALNESVEFWHTGLLLLATGVAGAEGFISIIDTGAEGHALSVTMILSYRAALNPVTVRLPEASVVMLEAAAASPFLW